MEIEQFNVYLESLIEQDALEIRVSNDEKSIYIPFMMNDAVECYITLTDCNIKGILQYDNNNSIFYELMNVGDRYGLILHQGDSNVTTIWFGDAHIYMYLYQYHRIGHRWRKEIGQEEIRRLVNLLCVLHDKCTHLGEKASNPKEMQLYKLIEFAPLCYWSPIDDSIESWYPESDDGVASMMELAEEAGDIEYVEILRRYSNCHGLRRKIYKKKLASLLVEDKHREIIELLRKKLEEASVVWPEREYDKVEMEQISALRHDKEMEWHMKGYTGTYPYLSKIDTATGKIKTVRFVEEQPYVFRELEFDNYQFRIYAIEE